MNLNRHLGLRTKIALPFVITALAIVLIGFLGFMTTRTLVSDANRLADDLLPGISEVLNGDRDLYQALVAQMSYIDAAEDGNDGSEFMASFQENAQQALDRMASARERLNHPDAEKELAGFQGAYSRWKQLAEQSMDMADNGNYDGAKALLAGDAARRFDTLRSYFDSVGVLADDNAQEIARHAVASGQRSIAITVIVTVAVVAVAALLFLVFMRLIIRSISALKAQLDNIAKGEGDLTQRVPVDSQDDLGQLATSFNHVLENLQTMIRTIQQLASQLGDGALRLETAARENDDGISRQTDSIAMVATAINEMQSAIEEVAGNASTASEVTQQAQENGSKGADIIRQSSDQVQRLSSQIEKAVEVIRKLSQDSDNITSVLDVIRDIADQTNLLALNAAIEAARAGEQGRGFAVVADEVRTLARRTQESTEDIQKMISTLQNGVSDVVSVMEAGSEQAGETERLANEAESEIGAIVAAMGNISDVNASVASATEEQTQVVDEINRSITDINDLASQSAARSRDINGISQSLAGYSRDLNDQTGRFRV